MSQKLKDAIRFVELTHKDKDELAHKIIQLEHTIQWLHAGMKERDKQINQWQQLAKARSTGL